MIHDKFNEASLAMAKNDGLPTASGIEVNFDDYLADLDGYEMTDLQKRQLLETLWSIARVFVELGFSPDTCGQLWQKFALEITETPGNAIVSNEIGSALNARISSGGSAKP